MQAIMFWGNEVKIGNYLPIFLIFTLTSLPLLAIAGIPRQAYGAQQDQILYFQATHTDLPPNLFYAMDTRVPLPGIGMVEALGSEQFVSYNLSQGFTYGIVNSTLFHEPVPSGVPYTITIQVGSIDANGVEHLAVSNSTNLAVGSTSTSLWVNYSFSCLQHERITILITVVVNIQYGHLLNCYWGNSTYPSQIRYSGTAVYVSEFPLSLILPLFMITTILAAIIYRRKTSLSAPQT
jgi:hypothetical protein